MKNPQTPQCQTPFGFKAVTITESDGQQRTHYVAQEYGPLVNPKYNNAFCAFALSASSMLPIILPILGMIFFPEITGFGLLADALITYVGAKVVDNIVKNILDPEGEYARVGRERLNNTFAEGLV